MEDLENNKSSFRTLPSVEGASQRQTLPEATPTETMEAVCCAHWQQVYAFVCGRGYSPCDAEDITQEFFLAILARNSLGAADRAKGSFEGYLFGALKHFLADSRDRAAAEKRGGRIEFVSIDATENDEVFGIEDTSAHLSPENVYDRRRAIMAQHEATARLREDFRLAGKLRQFEMLEPYLIGKGRRGEYGALATELGMTPAGIAMSVYRMRQRMGELLKASEEIAFAFRADSSSIVICCLASIF